MMEIFEYLKNKIDKTRSNKKGKIYNIPVNCLRESNLIWLTGPEKRPGSARSGSTTILTLLSKIEKELL